MRSIVVAIVDVLGHEAFQMAFIEHNHVVKQIAAAGADKALCDTVLPRALKTGSLGCGPQKSNLRLCGGTFECIFMVKSTQNRGWDDSLGFLKTVAMCSWRRHPFPIRNPRPQAGGRAAFDLIEGHPPGASPAP